MLLKIKELKFNAGKPVIILNKNTAKKLHVDVGNRLKIISSKGYIVSVLDIASSMVKEKEAIISQEIVEKLKLKPNCTVEVYPVHRPLSIDYINKKFRGKPLNYTEIYAIVSDIVSNTLTEAEMAYFTSAMYIHEMGLEELTNFIKAIVRTGSKMSFNNKFVLDKHCAGGIPGNRTTLLVVPIIAAALDDLHLNAIIPKTSSRAITSAAGTADVVETIAPVELDFKELNEVIKKTRACMIWNGTVPLAPADDKLIRVEKAISLESDSKLIASILAKKIAAGATHVLLDIPCGPGSKFSLQAAKKIKKKIALVSAKLGLKVKIILTDGSHPIGHGVGPVLEMRDIIDVLKRDKKRPMELERKSLHLSADLLVMTGKISSKQAYFLCKQILYTGRAYEKFLEIIRAQGGNINKISDNLKKARYVHKFLSSRNGKIILIRNREVASIARTAGAPSEIRAGVYLFKRVGDRVHKGEPLFEVYADSKQKLDYVKKILKHLNPFKIQ
ncbi:MAG: thymidine phosphorylase [archaeon]